jgi:phosphatidylserine/phosphatidylglycerophosphate/cardiolipin synthase-like enzyme
MGQTRPYTDDVKLPYAPHHSHETVYEPGPELAATLEAVRHHADWINRYTTPFFDQDGKTDEEHMARFVRKLDSFKEHLHVRDELIEAGHDFNGEIRAYHEALVRAFALAMTGPGESPDLEAAQHVADAARQIMLGEVILPYDRLLGQRKQHDSLHPLCANAERVFERWVRTEPWVPGRGRPGVNHVFRTVLDFLEENRAGSFEIWGDSRLVWVPLHYALRLEDHDTQAEIDALVERATGTHFSDGNRISYVVNELYDVELARMILSAEDYHVLWIHDYRGRNPDGTPDEIGYRMTVEAYLQALIDRVRAYDETWKIPTYLIFLDQFFFEANDGRLWMELLADPMNHEVDLPAGYEEWEENIRAKQQELRDAVARSATLQRAREEYGRKWVENLVKVHVNITNPTDLSFRSRHLINGLTIAPDILMRDHRKISFYDVTELDPGRGEAIYTGMGVGEHYAGATWDDRALLASGPALLTLKREAHALLVSQGFDEKEIPPALQPLPLPGDYEERVAQLAAEGWGARGLQAHNVTGYGFKRANLIKAVLYSVMPSGSHLYVPDSLWNSPVWGGFMVGAALRGCWVFPVSPALSNAPSDGVPQMSRANELFTRFVVIQDSLREEIERAGGRFRVGVYDLDVGVGDVLGRLRILEETVTANPWLREVFPFGGRVYAAVDSLERVLTDRGFSEAYLRHGSDEHRPKLHLKAQLFLSPAVASRLPQRQEWGGIAKDYLAAKLMHVQGLTDGAVMDAMTEAEDEAVALYEDWASGLEGDDEAIAYLTVGSHNQDIRGKVMDGESLYAVSGSSAMTAYLDFVALLSETTWVRTIEELGELIPPHSGFWRWVGRHIRIVL